MYIDIDVEVDVDTLLAMLAVKWGGSKTDSDNSEIASSVMVI